MDTRPCESGAAPAAPANHHRYISPDIAASMEVQRPAPIDFQAIAARALSSAEAVCRHWLPEGKRQGAEWVSVNPVRADQTAGSFSINLHTGKWADFATDDKGGDLVSLVAYLEGANQGEAGRVLAEWLGCAPMAETAPKATQGAPKAMKTRPTAHPKLGKPSAQWDYQDAEGRVLCAVLRFETATGKEFRPITRTPDGWIWKAPSEPRPLYGLDRLAARPDAPVILAEGEQAADAAAVLLPECVHIAAMNGARSPKRSDWSPLQGRRVLIWPDADAPGAQFAQDAASLASKAGAQSVEVLDLSSLGVDLPDKWDAADAVADGWTAERLAQVARFVPMDRTPPRIDEPAPAEKTEGITPASLVEAAIQSLPDDPGAIFEPNVVSAWANLQTNQPAAYVRLRAEAKRAKASVRAIDEAVKKYARETKNARDYFDSYTYDPYAVRAESIRRPYADPTQAYGLTSGSLLHKAENGKRTRLIESLAAEQVADAMRERLAWDSEAGTWRVWSETHWEVQPQPAKAEATLANAVHVGTHPLGYRLSYLNGVTQIIQRRGLLAPPEHPANVIPFRNGLLDIDTFRLERATPQRALDWVLPHDYAPDADCPTIQAWLKRSVEGDQETVELLRAWMAALVRGISLQKFLMLLGPGGSGKGTFQNLVTALIGAHNIATSALRDLEENRFECAKLYGRRLCMINEAGRHGGALNMLKAITGGDHVPLERKHVQQTGSFVFTGLVLMATTEDLQSTDTTSGLERRRITVRFPVTATDEEIADWDARGGAEAVLHPEIPGLINRLLAMPVADIRTRIKNPPLRVVTDNLFGMAAGNSVADWMLQNTVPDRAAWVQVGVKVETRDSYNGKVSYENADHWLYPNYLKWCLESGRTRPVALRKFKDTVLDLAKMLKHPVDDKRVGRQRASGIGGLRLARADEMTGPEVWRTVYPYADVGSAYGCVGQEPSNCMERRDNAETFVSENVLRAHFSGEAAATGDAAEDF